MSCIDILKTKLCISDILSVVKSQRTSFVGKELFVKSRHSDAFVFVLSGKCLYECRGSSPFLAKEGDVIYLANGAEYKMIHKENGVFSYIFCDFMFLSDDGRASVAIPSLEKREICDSFFKLHKAFSRENPASHAECLSLLYKIYSDIILISERDYLSSPTANTVRRAKNIIDDSFTSTELSVESVATEVGVSEVYLRRLFNLEFGTSPSQYIISKRLANAEALMKEKTLSIEECAKQSGFSSLQYFSRIYKAKKGISPGKAR